MLRNSVLFTVLLLPAAFADGATVPAESPGMTSLFNGKDLAGWEGLLEQFWSVKDGAIVGTKAPDGIKFNTFLCSKK